MIFSSSFLRNEDQASKVLSSAFLPTLLMEVQQLTIRLERSSSEPQVVRKILTGLPQEQSIPYTLMLSSFPFFRAPQKSNIFQPS
jgi:hypothetical protein